MTTQPGGSADLKTAHELPVSKLNRLRNRLEKKGIIRPPTMEIHQLRKPSQLFNRGTMRSSHRREGSVDEIVLETSRLELSPASSTNSRDTTGSSINASPEVETVSNFSSPARSIGSLKSPDIALCSPTRLNNSPPLQFVPPLPKITIVDGDDDDNNNDNHNNEEVLSSRLSRLRRKTMSLFFDHDPSLQAHRSRLSSSTSSSILNPASHNSSNSSNDNAPSTRPRINKTLSDGRQETLLQNQQHHQRHQPRSAAPSSAEFLSLQLQKELGRKRSRTLGSVEDSLYHKRNGSIVKAIGSMVMLKQRPTNLDLLSPSSAISDSSDNCSNSTSRPQTPPEIGENETPQSYISKLIESGFDSELSSLLALNDSDFMKRCLSLYIKQKFDFTDDPLDIALRRFLLTCELPKESQQIDRVLDCFSDRFYETNVHLWDNKDQIYFLTFSLVMLQTDHFNSNNKKKMTKEEFVKNTRVDTPDEKINNAFLSKEILEYFYDNITYTRFIQKNSRSHPQQQPPQPLYLLPRRIFSSTSSTNLEVMNNNGNGNNYPSQRTQSISSSTSQFFSSQLDPYFYIASDQLDSLKLTLDTPNVDSSFNNNYMMNSSFFESNFKSMGESLVNTNGAYIRFNKECNWIPGRTEIQFVEGDEIQYSKTCFLKIIKVAELYKEETIFSSKFFTIGASNNKIVWKKYYGVLTTCGLFIFDDLNFVSITDREKLLKLNHFENGPLIIDVFLDSILRQCSKLSINGLFACESSEENNYNCTFNIFSTNKRELFSTRNFSEMSSWILAINYVAALDGCIIDYPIKMSHEVVPIQSISVEDKIAKLLKNIPVSKKKADDVLRLQNHLKILTPFSSKTRDSLSSHYQSLNIRMKWLWYEVERNQVYVKILTRKLQQDRMDDRGSLKPSIDDQGSFLEDSFITDETAANHSKVSQLSNVLSSENFLSNDDADDDDNNGGQEETFYFEASDGEEDESYGDEFADALDIRQL